jgi:methyl-accepting chemotaxis protein
MTANHSGHTVLSAYAPVSVKGATWAILAEIREAEAFSAVFQLKMAIGIIVAVGIALILPIAWLTTRSMTRPVYRIIRGLNVGADQVASAAWEVASASQQLAEGSSDQAAAIEETTASLEEMASMTSRNVESAGTATQLMTETSEVVNRADAAMSDLSRSMDNISAASNETSKIIRAIDDIAFQTNLLALNAAVEAARAGESAGASEELSAQTEQMKRMVQDLSSLIEGSPAPRKSAARPFSKWSSDESVSKSGNSGVAA